MTSAGFVHQTRVLGTDEHQSHHILQTAVLQKRLLVMNGGVVIYSRHPITRHDYTFFQGTDINSTDAYAMKGFIYACIKVPATVDGRIPCRLVHIIGTHLQGKG
jgi:hypothetical protein